MAITDYGDKLGMAEDYLLKYSPDSQEFQAALEHVTWVYANTEHKNAARALLARVVTRRGHEQRFSDVMKDVKLK